MNMIDELLLYDLELSNVCQLYDEEGKEIIKIVVLTEVQSN